MERNETPEAAALRELREESGIEDAEVVRILGDYFYSMRKFGRGEIQHRRVVHVMASDSISMKECWTHFEAHPSSGGEPIELSLQWLPLFEKEFALIGGHDFFLPMLQHFVREHSEIRMGCVADHVDKSALFDEPTATLGMLSRGFEAKAARLRKPR